MTTADRLAPVIVVMAALLAGINALDASPVGVFYDDAHYAILGRALATGEGYRYINVPGAPAATHFPPGYPALLALLWQLSPSFPENIALFKMTNAVLLGVVAIGAYWAARRLVELRPTGAALTALCGTAAIPILVLSSSVMSETLFLAMLLPVLVLSDEHPVRRGDARAALIGAGAGALYLVRSHAIVLVPAMVIGLALRRRYRQAGTAMASAMLPMLPWLIWVWHNDPLVPPQLRGQYASYASWIAEGLGQEGARLLLLSLRENVGTSYAIVARSFSPAQQWWLDALAVASVVALFGTGMLALFRRAPTTVLFVLLYLASALVWPFSPLRLIWGVWPLLVLVMVAGAVHLWGASVEWRGRRVSARAVGGVAALVALVGALTFNARGYANSWWATVSRSFTPRIQAQLVWVTEKTAHRDLIVTDDEGAVYLYTGRRALPASGFTAAQHVRPRSPRETVSWLAETVRAFAPDYVVAWSRPTQDAAGALAARRPPVLERVDTIPAGRVYRRAMATDAQAAP